MNISDIWPFTTSTLMMETKIYETLDFSSTVKRLIARENVNAVGVAAC
jgi:hypothetical protein